MSLCRSGSWTVRRTSSTCSWETVTCSSFLEKMPIRRPRADEGLVDGLLQLLELLGRGADELQPDHPLGVDDEGGGKPAVGAEGIEQLVGAEELAVRDAVLAHEVLDLLRLPGGKDDAHDLDPPRLVLAGELRVVRHLGDAGAAPGGPHVEHHDLALQRGQAHPPAFHRGQVEGRRGAGLRRLGAPAPHPARRRATAATAKERISMSPSFYRGLPESAVYRRRGPPSTMPGCCQEKRTPRWSTSAPSTGGSSPRSTPRSRASSRPASSSRARTAACSRPSSPPGAESGTPPGWPTAPTP